jgi:hypothetical protein
MYIVQWENLDGDMDYKLEFLPFTRHFAGVKALVLCCSLRCVAAQRAASHGTFLCGEEPPGVQEYMAYPLVI